MTVRKTMLISFLLMLMVMALSACGGRAAGNSAVGSGRISQAAQPAQEVVTNTITTSGGQGATMGEKFATVQLDGSGTAEITITEAELNVAISQVQTATTLRGRAVKVQEFTVRFTGGTIIVGGTVPDTGYMEVVFRPYVNSGILQFEVISATAGGVNVPPLVWQPAEQALNDALSQALGQLPPGVGLQSITVGEGFMTVIVGVA